MRNKLVVLVDEREQQPLPLDGLCDFKRASLGNQAGDYVAENFAEFAVIERKNPDDLVSSMTGDYPRFKAELNVIAFEKRVPHRVVLVEAPSCDSVIRTRRLPYGNAVALKARVDTVAFRYGFAFIWKATPEEAARWTVNALQWVVDTYSDETVAAAERAARDVLPRGMRGGAKLAHDAAARVGKCAECLRDMPKRLVPIADPTRCACGRKRPA